MRLQQSADSAGAAIRVVSVRIAKVLSNFKRSSLAVVTER